MKEFGILEWSFLVMNIFIVAEFVKNIQVHHKLDDLIKSYRMA